MYRNESEVDEIQKGKSKQDVCSKCSDCYNVMHATEKQCSTEFIIEIQGKISKQNNRKEKKNVKITPKIL